MRTRTLALLAFVVMCVQDIAGTFMVVQEASYHILWSGFGDEVQWAAGLASMLLAADEIIKRGWTHRARVVCLALSLANFVGTGSGILLGGALNHHGVSL
jgi:hypothetical protein